MDIFKDYDIRGQFPDEVNTTIVRQITDAFLCYLKNKKSLSKGAKFLVGYDGRISSPALADEVMTAFTMAGFNLDNLGLTTTDLFYFAAAQQDYAGSIMVTASHNPADQNGLKIMAAKVQPVSGDALQELKSFLGKKLPSAGTGNFGEANNLDLTLEFCNSSLNEASSLANMNWVADFGNSTAALFKSELERVSNSNMFALNKNIDGNFPGRGPNPALDHVELSRRVRGADSSFGAAWDADADRVIFVDEKGDMVLPDTILALLAKDQLKIKPGASIAYDAVTSRIVPETIIRLDGNAIQSKVGRTNIQETMRQEGAILGGEVSGHYYYNFDLPVGSVYFENTLVTLGRVARIIAESGKTFSELVHQTNPYFKSSGLVFNIDDFDKVAAKVRQAYPDAEAVELDGLSLNYPDWWFNIRPSNTESIVRLTIEAKSLEVLDEKIRELTTLLK